MKILIISSKPPFPTIDGGCYASARLLESVVNTGNEVKFLTVATKKHPFELDCFPQELIKQSSPESVYLNTRVSASKAFIHLFKKGSYNVTRFHQEVLQKRIIELLKEQVDMVILDGLFVTSYIDTIRKHSTARILLRSHNIEADIWDDYARMERKMVKKLYLKRLAKDIRAYEIRVFKSVDVILAISTDDAEKIKSNVLSTKVVTTPVSIKVFQKAIDYSNSGFFHIGAMNWPPNVEAVKHLLALTEKLKLDSLHVKIAGSSMSEWKEVVPDYVEKVGFVEDPALFAVTSGILVSPIKSGSGVRIKILEMLAAGVPVITTPKGAEGLFEKDVVLIGSTDEELMSHMKKLSESEASRKSLGEQGVKYIEKYHNPVQIEKQLIDLFNDIKG